MAPPLKKHMRRWHVISKFITDEGWYRGVELGVKGGTNLRYLLQHHPSLHMTGVDTWEPQPEKGEQYALGGRSYSKAGLPRLYDLLVEHIVEKKWKKRCLLLRMTTLEAAGVVDIRSDFVFIDADHLEDAVRADIEAWKPLVRPGGMLMGHDIHFPGVRAAVDDLCHGWQEYDASVWGVRMWL